MVAIIQGHQIRDSEAHGEPQNHRAILLGLGSDSIIIGDSESIVEYINYSFFSIVNTLPGSR